MTIEIETSEARLRDQFMALRSAVDLLTDCVSPVFVEQVLADYRPGGARNELARSLYALLDALEERCKAVPPAR